MDILERRPRKSQFGTRATMSGPVARAFLVVRLERSGDDLRSVLPRACVSATYGADGGDGTTHDCELVATVHTKNFAFPERDLSEAIGDDPAAPPLTYTFSLTEGDGSRTTGFCRRIAPAREWGERDGDDGDGRSSGVIVACILSRNAWFSFFEEALASIDERVRTLPQVRAPPSASVHSLGDELPAEGELGRFMRELCARPTPAPGAAVVVPFPWHEPGTAYPSQIELAAPTAGGPNGSSGNASNPDVKFASLLRQPGGTYAVVSLFAALLMERRVVISGSDLRRVSQAVVAANASMYPLAWQHIYLPLMPRAFVDYLTAPMPFLVGLHSSLVPEMRALPTEDIFHLDLDSGECSHFPEDLDSMPTRTTQTLQSALKKAAAGGGRHAHERDGGGADGDTVASMNGGAVGPTGDALVDDDAAAAAFRRFFSQTLGPYRRHIVQDGRKTRDGRARTEDNIGANGLWLDHEGLARAAPTKRTGVLLRQMRGAQYFEVFARERLDAIASALKAGEEVLYKDVDFDTEMDDYAEMYDTVRQSAARASAAAASAASYGYKKSAEYYSSFVKSYTAYYNKNAVGASTPQKVKRVAVPGLGLRTVASPSSTFSPAAGSPWEDSAERFRQATVQVAGSDGGSRDDDGSNGGPPGGAVIGSAEDAEPSTAAADRRDDDDAAAAEASGEVEKVAVEKVGGVDERFASPPPAPPASPPTVALGDLLGLDSEPAGVPGAAERSPAAAEASGAGGIGIDWMSDFVVPAGVSKTPDAGGSKHGNLDDLAASFDGLASPTPQKPGAETGPTNLLDL